MEAIVQVGEEFAAACTWLDERGYRPDVAFTPAQCTPARWTCLPG
jgi:hypothetical protein